MAWYGVKLAHGTIPSARNKTTNSSCFSLDTPMGWVSFSISTCPWVPAQNTHYSCKHFETPQCEGSEAPLELEADHCPSKQVLTEHSNPQSSAWSICWRTAAFKHATPLSASRCTLQVFGNKPSTQQLARTLTCVIQSLYNTSVLITRASVLMHKSYQCFLLSAQDFGPSHAYKTVML